MLVLDGSYSRVLETGELRFHKSPAPSTEEVAAVVEEIAVRAAHWLIRQGVRNLEEPDPDDLQLCLQAAAAAGVAALGPRAGRRARRVQRLGGRLVRLPPRCATIDGFNLHAGVIVPASDRKGLERICRYLARPPLAREQRLSRFPPGDDAMAHSGRQRCSPQHSPSTGCTGLTSWQESSESMPSPAPTATDA
jgi:hypothetical protein